jgi:hypothetical protein
MYSHQWHLHGPQKWLGPVLMLVVLVACVQTSEMPPIREAAFSFKLVPLDERFSDNPEIALAELTLIDEDPTNDGYARLIISKGGSTGLHEFIRQNGHHCAVMKAEYEKFGIGYPECAPNSR